MHSEERDQSIVESAKKVVENWGGKYFFVELVDDPVDFVRRWKAEGGVVVHLTMYGINVDEVVDEIPLDRKVLVVVGSEKVEGVFYGIADFNVAVGNQPHSEVAALAVFLDRVYEGRELNLVFKDAKLKIIPERRGKRVVNIGREGEDIP